MGTGFIKFLIDFGPLALFFVGFKLHGLMWATAMLIIGTIISLGVSYAREKKVAMMPLVSGILVTVMGVLTLALNDDTFIKMKPTLVNTMFAAILLVGVFGMKRGLMRYVLEMAFKLTEEGWLKLSTRWGFFFLFLALLNEVIWRNFSTSFWVNFKVFGMLTISLAFTFAQLPLIKKHLIEEKK